MNAYAAPSPDSIAAVSSWLQAQNISANTTGPFGEYLSFSIPVSKANELLSAEYTNFTYSSSSGPSTWSLYTYAYSLPANVSQYISHIHPATSFAPPLSRDGRTTFYQSEKSRQPEPSAKFATRANSAPDSCATLVPPSCLSSLYGMYVGLCSSIVKLLLNKPFKQSHDACHAVVEHPWCGLASI